VQKDAWVAFYEGPLDVDDHYRNSFAAPHNNASLHAQ
jgi:hypothetical protein